MIGEVDHIEIVANDADEMADFLTAIGFEEHRRTDHHGGSIEVTPADADGPVFEIHTVEEEENPGINHIAFSIDDIDQAMDRLKTVGVNHLTGPQFVESTGRTSINFRDPDGRRLQLVADED